MNRTWYEDTKRLKTITDNTVKCKCGHSVLIKDKSYICNYCGRKVYTPKEQFNIGLKRALERKCI